MINSDKIAFQVFEAVEDGKFLPINKKISLEYLDSNMDGIFDNEKSWRSFINGNFLCESGSCKLSTIKKWTYSEEEYINLFVVKVGQDKYINVSPDDVNLEFDYSLYYSSSSSFPSAVELFVTATIKMKIADIIKV